MLIASIYDNLSFISNKVYGIHANPKQFKVFEYFRYYVPSNGFIFLQGTHASFKDEKVWSNEFKEYLFSLMEKPALVVLPLVFLVQSL